MKTYQTITKFVEACQFDGTEDSILELRKMVSSWRIKSKSKGLFFDGTKLEKGYWIVKQVDTIETYEVDETMYKFVVMRDDQFQDRYTAVCRARNHEYY